MQKISSKHRIWRSIGELDARAPSLINLPLPVDSIPVVGPLASPLVGGGAQPSTPPIPPPAPVPSNGNGGGNGGGKGNGNGGGNGNGNGNGGGNGNGNGGGGTPFPTSTPTNGGGNPVPPRPTPPNSAPGAQPSAQNPGTGSGMSSPSSQQGGDFLGTGGGKTVPVNAASGPPTFGASTPMTTGFSLLSQSSPGTVGAAVPSPTISTAAAISSGKQLPVGAAAGITIVCLFFLLALTLLVIRRRSIAHRLELRKQWWFGRNISGYSFISRSTRSPVGSNGEAPVARLSARSSFATNFDHGLTLRVDSPSRFSLGLLPEFPPTAEVRERNSALVSTGGAAARRESMNSMLSNGSDPDAQYLTVSAGQNNLEPSTPMSVRPFSPSESFAFPKPPAPPSSTADSFFLGGSPGLASPLSSAATLIHLSTPPRAFMSDLPPTSSLNPQTSTPCMAPSPFVAAANPSVDPFIDPPKPEFSDVEVIRRPFTPSLDDEIAVVPDDRVRIIRVFDDGWAFVEKLAGDGGERHGRGLIPVDCFRNVEQALPSFLVEKRVSYRSQHVLGTAL